MYLKVEGLDDLIKISEKLASAKKIEDTNKAIFDECNELIGPVLKRNTPVSKDNRKSGIKGNRPAGDLRDNIPTKVVRKQAGYYYMLVGWEKISKKTPWFYAKYLEWGTSKINPVAMFGKTQEELQNQFEQIGLKHYEKLVKELEK